MPVRDPKEVFLVLLSNVRQGAECVMKIYSGHQSTRPGPGYKRSTGGQRAFISLLNRRQTQSRASNFGGRCR